MGTIIHNITCVVLEVDDPVVTEIKEWIGCLDPNYARHIVGPTTMVNGYVSFAILPDGSKMGWEHHDTVTWMRHTLLGFTKRARWPSYITAQFGGDLECESKFVVGEAN